MQKNNDNMHNDDKDVIINHHAHHHLPDGINNYLFQNKAFT